MELGIILLTSLCCVGWHVATDTLLHHVTGKGWSDHWDSLTKAQQTILKPLGACPTCMASVCGTIGHFYFYMLFNLAVIANGDALAIRFLLIEAVGYWPVTVLAVAYLNTLLIRWVE
jgi:hypothetical protein